MTLDATVRLDDRAVDVSLSVADGETLALLGPNGAGKSSVLAALAGLVRPDAGHVTLDGRVLAGDTWVPAHDRDIALLAQDARLFPHLSVLDNVAFGPRARGAGRRGARATGERWLAEVGITAYAHRRPHELSGGQQQRVAVARALATEPRVLLVDEPLSALDVEAAPDVRDLLRRVLADRTAVVVTHDVVDAALLADRVAVMEHGRVVDEGPAARVLGRPRSDFGARFAGLNLVRGVAESGALRMPDGRLLHGLAEEREDPPVPIHDGARLTAVVAPTAVGVHLTHPHGSPRNALTATVTDLEPHGHLVRVRTDTLTADITPGAAAELGLRRGSAVVLSVKATEVHLHVTGTDL